LKHLSLDSSFLKELYNEWCTAGGGGVWRQQFRILTRSLGASLC
jgi:hypothetical protein